MESNSDGIKIGKYTLNLKEIGTGSYGTVFIAKDDKGNYYAVKRVNYDKLARKVVKEKFIREIKLTYKLNNKHIVQMIDILKTEKHVYIFLEYCNGETLNSFLEKYYDTYQTLIPQDIIQIFTKQIIEGLAYMAKKNCIHRDLKLENIMLTSNLTKEKENEFLKTLVEKKSDLIDKIPCKKSIFAFNTFSDDEIPQPFYFSKNFENIKNIMEHYTVKLIDLGFAKQVENNENITSYCGSPFQMPPEIWSLNYGKGTSYNKKCDLWSLGCTLYNLAFNSFPFLGNDFKEIYKKILNGKYAIKKVNGLSIEFVDLICGLLKVNPEYRYDYDILINHPFITKKFEDLEPYDFGDQSKIILDANKKENILKNIEIIKKNVLSPEESIDDEEKEKYIDEIFMKNCEIIEYSVRSKEINDWVYVSLNSLLV